MTKGQGVGSRRAYGKGPVGPGQGGVALGTRHGWALGQGRWGGAGPMKKVQATHGRGCPYEKGQDVPGGGGGAGPML